MNIVLLAILAGCPSPVAEVPPASPPEGMPAAPEPVGLVNQVMAASGGPTGAVTEVLVSGGYTYVSVKTADGKDVWAAGPETKVAVGDKVTLIGGMMMKDFSSPTLGRSFPEILFVTGIQVGDAVVGAPEAAAPMGAVGGSTAAGAVSTEVIAAPAGGVSIGDLVGKRAEYAGKTVTVRGKVMKSTNAMGKWFVHLQDGSGDVAAKTNDLTVTSATKADVGAVVTASGTLVVDKDLGAGYAYEAILEDATFTP